MKCRKNITTDAITFVNTAISTNMDVCYINEDTIMKLNRILNTDVFRKDENTPRITRLHKFNYLDENMRLGFDICELSEVR